MKFMELGTLLLLLSMNAIPPSVKGLGFLSKVELVGEAKGGSLLFVDDNHGYTYSCWEVKAAPGQSADQVAEALTQSLRTSTPASLVNRAVKEGSSIFLPGGGYYFAGTETGFNVLRSPVFVTINYTPDDTASVFWEISETHDAKVVVDGLGSICAPAELGTKALHNVSEQLVHDSRTQKVKKLNPNDLGCYVYASISPKFDYPDSVSYANSRPVRIHVSGKRQEDLDNVPFYGNVMPNWRPWSREAFAEGNLRLYQGEKSEVPEPARSRAFAESPDTKFTCQMFEIQKDIPAEGGVYRRYLGLTPGHKYRVFARFNTFESDPKTADWRLSFHACADPAGKGLSVEQLSGKKPLPSGATVPGGACIAAFGTNGQTTGGKWVQASTGMEGACADIEIPQGSSSLSAWVRVSGNTPTRFGMDWSALEDVTPSGQPAPTTE